MHCNCYILFAYVYSFIFEEYPRILTYSIFVYVYAQALMQTVFL